MITCDHWRAYHDPADLARAADLCSEHSIESTGVRIHIDGYLQPDAAAPVFIFNHGGGGYSRLFIPIALALYDRGYSVLLPDQRGQGFSAGDRGDFTYPQLIQNVIDVAGWARERFAGPLFMGGGSVGSGITYAAGAAGAPVRALVCHNLYAFDRAADGLALSRLAPLRHLPGFPALARLGSDLAGQIAPGLKIPFGLLGRFEQMVDARMGDFYDIWRADPLPIKAVSLRYIRSSMTTPAAVPFEQNTLPVLVINPTRDRMVSPEVTWHNYQRLGGPKQYAYIDYGHWAMGEAFVGEWTAIVDDFLRPFWT